MTEGSGSIEDIVIIENRKNNNVPANYSVKTNISDTILNYAPLKEAIDLLLPKNYNFEIYKTIDQIHRFRVKRAALQLPEGLQMFAIAITTILENFCYHPVLFSPDKDEVTPCLEIVILADVTYGACCIDDYTAKEQECDFLIHYGHSCLVPITKTMIRVLYVFVDISFDIEHLLETIKFNFTPEEKVTMIATIQFSSSLQKVHATLLEDGYRNITTPQAKPLSPGEVLGCTSPRLKEDTKILYLGDGRFHLESMMIANPHLDGKFFRYDPYTGKLTREWYVMQEMLKMRKDAILKARSPSAKRFAIVLGTLGRQGNVDVMSWLKKKLEDAEKEVLTILMPELSPSKLQLFSDIDVFIQTSCPRLSIDWGSGFAVPLLTPYEAMLSLLPNEEWIKKKPKWLDKCNDALCNCIMDDSDMYPMDFYANDSLGRWTPNYKQQKEKNAQEKVEKRAALKAKLEALRKTKI